MPPHARRLYRCTCLAASLLASVGLAARAADPTDWSPRRWESNAAPPPATRPLEVAPIAPPSTAPRRPLAPGEFLLDHNHSGDPGEPPFVLRDALGAVQRYVEPTVAIDLVGVVGAVARIRHDTGQTLLATQLDIDPVALAPAASGGFAPLATVRPAGYQSTDPTVPIVLEELPVGNPAPVPMAAPSLGQPDLVTPAPAATGGVYAEAYFDPECGDACAPYGYSGNPTPLASSMAELLNPGWFLPAGGWGLPPIDTAGIEFGGWTQLGYHTDQTPLSVSFGDRRAFNDVPSAIRLQQQWFWIAKEADGSRGPDWGFRFDVTYGTDAQKTQAFGNPGAMTPGVGAWDASLDHGIYGWAMPQLYGQLAADEWSLIYGHFFTPVGYEVIAAPDNFFYSHSLTMFNSEPFTHTGALATFQPHGRTNGLEVYLGYTLGWDTGFDQAFGGSTFVGGFSVRPLSSMTLAYVATAGNLGARSGGGSGYTHSIVADVAVTPRLTYVLQSDYVGYDDRTGTGLGDDQVGVNQYLLYALNRCWGAGGRLEWWKSDGASHYQTTLGLNYRPALGFVVRPEVRFDRAPGRDETSLAIDAILTY